MIILGEEDWKTGRLEDNNFALQNNISKFEN